MAKLVTVTLDPETGELETDLTGFQGQGCEAIAQVFKDLGEATESKKKPEYNQRTINLVRK